MFTENWASLMNGLMNNKEILESYNELLLKRTRQYFARLSVYE